MSSIALERTDVIVGVDTHKDEHVAVVIDGLGGRLGEYYLSVTNSGYAELLAWAKSLGRVHAFGPERAKVWEVFARFRELLNDNNLVEYLDIIREARLYIEKQNLTLPYRAVLADEVQDFAPNALKLLVAIAPDDQNGLFMVGDAHQRIYGFATSLSHCGIEVGGRIGRLQLSYRTTSEIRLSAEHVLEGRAVDDLDLGTDTLKYTFSLRHGPNPEFHHCESEAQEAAFVVELIKSWLEAGVPDDSICLAVRTNSQLRDRYEAILAGADIPTVHVGRTSASERGPGVRLATMHRMKGLEFSCVLLAGVQEGMMPLSSEHTEAADAAGREDWELRERCLFYVAQSRARDGLAVTGYGKPSPFVPGTSRGTQHRA